jgi:hypothetical protein
MLLPARGVHGPTKESTMSARILRTLALSAGLAVAHTVHAQCDIYWPNVPDFDQRRVTRVDPNNPFIVTHVGLPNNGSVHCVPTSIANLLAILDDAGFNVIPNSNQPNWEGQLPIYNTVGTLLFNLGEYMDTDDGGTNHGDSVEGMVDWISDRGYGMYFIGCGFKADDDKFPRPSRIYQLVKAGWPTTFGYGRYYRDGDELERDGGHAITAVGTYDGCDLMRPQVLYHDPNTSPDNESRILQSEFTTVTRTLYRRFWNMDGDLASVYSFDETFNGTAEDPVRVFDSYRYILPLIALGVHPVNPNLLVSFQLPGVFTGSGAQQEEATSPTAGPILDIAFDHTEVSHVVLAGAGRGGQAGLFAYDFVGRSFDRLASFDRNPDRLLLDRYGACYVQLGAIVQKYKLVDNRPIPLGSLTLPSPATAWAIDDATDTIVALTDNNTRLVRFTADLSPVGNTPIPGGLTLPGDGSVAINPLTGRVWLASSLGAGAFEIAFDTNGRTSVASTASNSALRNIKGFSFDRLGNMLALCDGSVRQFALSASSGRWSINPDSPWGVFADMRMSRLTDLTRSRHNENARNLTPGWRDIDPVDEPFDPGVPQCGADFNLDGFLDFFDYDEYVQCYEGGRCPRGRTADYNGDNFVDFFDYNAYVEDFERGC